MAFVDIALHRRGPDELPKSTFLLVMVVAAYLAVSFVAVNISFAVPAEEGAVASVLDQSMLVVADTVIYTVFIWGLLKSFRHDTRFLQTAIALIGLDTLFTVASLPLLVWAAALQARDALTTAPSLFYFLLLIWSIDVAGFVLARALGRPYVVAVLIVLGYVALTVTVRAAMFAPAGA